jgi:hypothetical protein
MKYQFVLAIACVAVWGGVASADVLIDSGTPPWPGDFNAGQVDKAIYYDPATAAGQFISQAFTLTDAALITGIDSFVYATPGAVMDVRLTTKIGLAATAADQLAAFSLTSTQFEPKFYGSGPLSVTLPAGTYFLVYSATANIGGGVPGFAPTDIGMLTFANTSNGSESFINAANPPASKFFTHHDEGDIGLRVNGVVPEPGMSAVAMIVLGLTCARRRRRV